MPAGLEQTVKKIFTFDTTYGWKLECNDVSPDPEFNSDTELAYKVEVTKVSEDKSRKTYSAIFRIPKLERGLLQSDGKRRQSIYTAYCNSVIRIGNRYFAWGNGYADYQSLDVSTKDNHVRMTEVYNQEAHQFGESTQCYLSNFLKYWNKWDENKVYLFSKQSLAEADSKYNEDVKNIEKINNTLVIPEEVLKKLRFLSKRPNLKNKIDSGVVDAFINIIENDTLYAGSPTPMDYRFLDTYESLNEMFKRDYATAPTRSNKIRSAVIWNMQKNDSFTLTAMQNVIADFFKPSSDSEFSNIQDPTDSNALTIAELNAKIYFKKWHDNSYEQQRLNPRFFVGMIDPVFTADSNLVNIKNELAIDCTIRDGKMYVTVLDKNFNKVTLEAYDYLMSGVLSSDNIDYVHKKYFPINGKYSIYKYGEYSEVTSPEEFTYLRQEDSILTDSLSMIPFVNKTQSMRSMLGAHMLTQAIPVVGSQPMFIDTGKGKELYHETALNEGSKIDGTVTAISENFMKIQSDTGKVELVKRPEPYNTSDGTTNLFRPAVKVGDKVKAGDTVYECNSFKDKDFAIGVPLLTCYTSFHGWEHEDAIVISESAAKKFTHKMLEVVEIPVRSNENWIVGGPEIQKTDAFRNNPNGFDEFGFIKIGEYVRRGDPLFVYEQVVSEEDERARLGKLIDPNSVLKDFVTITVPYEVVDGKVFSIRFIPTKNADKDFLNNNTYNTLISHFTQLRREDLKKQAEELGVSVKELGDAREKPFFSNDPRMMGKIQIEIIYDNPLKKSDKMSNYYGSKGVVSKIVPDDQMFRTEDGRVVEIIISELSVISRINISQKYVVKLGLISKTFYERLEKFFSLKPEDRDPKEEELLKKVAKILLYRTPDKPLKEIYEESIPYKMVRIRAGSLDTYFNTENIGELTSLLGIQNYVRLFDPVTGKWILNKIEIGYQDFLRLHFIAENKIKVTGIGKHQRVYGYGGTKAGGQKIGEAESWALMSYGDVDLLHKFSHERDDKAAKFSQEMLSIGLLLNQEKHE